MIGPNLNDYFSFYDLKPLYAIDKGELKQRYFELSKQYHPDHFGDSFSHQNEAILVSTYNNKAYKTLNNDISRAQYLVDLFHHTSEHSDSTLPQDFLFEMMDINESIDEADETEKQTVIKKEIEGFQADIKTDIEALANQEQWQDLQIALLKWKYIERLNQRITFS
ncbi:MAG: Fe-S protein assembly co-chaperone HscB [Bacteroidota bacterium]|nr:Fe-S protein assembly co-chaperone HscB [Bacteroidota bacterium]